MPVVRQTHPPCSAPTRLTVSLFGRSARGARRAAWRPAAIAVFAFAGSASIAHGQALAPVEEALEQLGAMEPTVQETQEAALRTAGLDALPDRDWGRAARRSSALPERVGIEAGLRDLRGTRAELTRTEELDGQQVLDALDWREIGREDDALQLEAGLVFEWDLRGLAWSREEAWATREALEIADRRVERMLEVADVYFARRAALAAYLDPSGTDAQRLTARLAFEEYTARLDAWTGGWFTAQLATAQTVPWPTPDDGVAR